MTTIPHLHVEDWPQWSRRLRKPYHDEYYAMYSSVYGGIVTDPVLMMVPVDDHLVHRGDGAFETLKCVDGGIYNLAAHLDRLETSARLLSLPLPGSREMMTEAALETVRAGRHRDCLIRILVSRGPGGLGVNPYESVGSQLYIVSAAMRPVSRDKAERGVKARLSSIPVKPGFFANIKSCNYLPNALMKKEAVDAGVDFVVSLDEDDCLAEGPAESIAIVTAQGELRFPAPGRVLPGTTLHRTAQLAEVLVSEGLLRSVAEGRIAREELFRAREVLVVGTTPDVLAVTEFEGRPVGGGKPGPVSKRLLQLLEHEIRFDPAFRTMVF